MHVDRTPPTPAATRWRRAAAALGAVGALALGLLTAAPAQAADRVPGELTGYAFDARCAPTQEQMDAWLTTSPFWGVGIYLGGSTVSCRPTATDPGQPHLDGTWVQRQTAAGWRLLPLWVGPQASCHPVFTDRIDATPDGSYAAADARGRAEATAAVLRARQLGLPVGSTLWYDLEGGWDVGDDDCRRSALRFLSGWTLALHDQGYRSGVYSSVSSGIHALDNADNLSSGSYTMPDRVWFAWYNNRADTDVDTTWVREGSWAGDRVHQYSAQEVATYGGVPLSIDRNYLELGGGSVAPKAPKVCRGTRLDFGSYRTQKVGRDGPRVRAAQCLLKKAARYRGGLDARFDHGVATAVRRFERKHDLRVDGKVDPRTWTALLSRGTTPLLKVGSAEESVRRVQRALSAATGRRVKVSGVYTDGTAAAVRTYQARVGITPTGVVADDTWAALQAGRR